MPITIENKELEILEELTSNFYYEELRWILSELRIQVTYFSKSLKISPSSLQLLSYNNELMPLYIIDKLLEVAGNPTRLLFLRNKYRKINESKGNLKYQ